MSGGGGVYVFEFFCGLVSLSWYVFSWLSGAASLGSV